MGKFAETKLAENKLTKTLNCHKPNLQGGKILVSHCFALKPLQVRGVTFQDIVKLVGQLLYMKDTSK